MWPQLLPTEVVVVEATKAMWSSPLTPREARCINKAGPKRRREFQAGRAAARAALHALSVDHFDLTSSVHRNPLWPDGIVGSITHTADRCAAAVALQTQITSLGIDIETGEELPTELIAIVCAEDERYQLLHIPDRSPPFWAKVIFSAKEAFFKAYFPQTGTFLDFRDLTIALRPSRGEFDVKLVNRDCPLLFGNQPAIGRYGVDDGSIYTTFLTIA
jgi:4'-phosphopantetheinyl transferase EntD